jgi:hypothetical protein
MLSIVKGVAAECLPDTRKSEEREATSKFLISKRAALPLAAAAPKKILAVVPDKKILPEVTILSETSHSTLELPMAQLDPLLPFKIGPVRAVNLRKLP